MNKNSLNFLILCLSILILFSCKTKKEVVEKERVRLNNYNDRELLDSLSKNEFKFDVLTAKANIKYTDAKETSFKTHLRIKKDSAIWMSITPLLGIEMARVLITKDSLKFMNRIDKQYFLGSFDYINEKFGVDLDYQMLEAILVGNSIDFDDDEKKIITSIDRKKHAYFISTARKRQIRKEIKKDKNKFKNFTQALWIAPDNFKIIQLMISAPKSDQSLVMTYTNHEQIDNQLFPKKINVTLSSEKIITIDVDFLKVILGNDDTSFSFKIPSKYERVEIK